MRNSPLNHQPLTVSNDVARMTNYYKTKFEGKVEQMVQSSIASSQLSGRPMLTPVQDVTKKEIEDLGLNASFHYKKLDVLRDMLNLNDNLNEEEESTDAKNGKNGKK